MEDIKFVRKRSNYKAGMISGLIASAVSSLVLILAAALAFVPQFNYIMIQGSLFGLASGALSAWVAYFLIGIFIWGNLYAAIEPSLTMRSNSAKGLVFGLIVWLIVMIIMMPMTNAGFFVREYGLAAALIVLVTDLVFGVVASNMYSRY